MQAPPEPPQGNLHPAKRNRFREALMDFVIFVLGGLALGLVLGLFRWLLGELGLASKLTGDVAGWVGSLAGNFTKIGLLILITKRVVSAFR